MKSMFPFYTTMGILFQENNLQWLSHIHC